MQSEISSKTTGKQLGKTSSEIKLAMRYTRCVTQRCIHKYSVVPTCRIISRTPVAHNERRHLCSTPSNAQPKFKHGCRGDGDIELADAVYSRDINHITHSRYPPPPPAGGMSYNVLHPSCCIALSSMHLRFRYDLMNP